MHQTCITSPRVTDRDAGGVYGVGGRQLACLPLSVAAPQEPLTQGASTVAVKPEENTDTEALPGCQDTATLPPMSSEQVDMAEDKGQASQARWKVPLEGPPHPD